jgi:hypothetical protein
MTADEIAREVRYTEAAAAQFFGSVSAAVVAEVIRDFTTYAARSRPLLPGEQGIVALMKPKTSALFADRVWLQYAGQDGDPDFSFGWASPYAVRLGALLAFAQATGNVGPPSEMHVSLTRDGSRFVSNVQRDLALEYSNCTGAVVVPLYDSALQRDVEYKPGTFAAITAVIENMAIVSEESLSWHQVIEFRKDSVAKAAYRRFIHWLDSDMVGQSADFMADEIAARMERYDWAVRKHGLQTVVGALECTLSPQSIFGSSAVALTIESLAHQPLLSVLGGAGLLLGKAAVSAATKLIEHQDIVMGQREIAFVHEVRKKFNRDGLN